MTPRTQALCHDVTHVHVSLREARVCMREGFDDQSVLRFRGETSGCPLPSGPLPESVERWSDRLGHLSWAVGGVAGFCFVVLLLTQWRLG